METIGTRDGTSISGSGYPAPTAMLDLTPQHLAALERLRAAGFAIVAFPMAERHVGARKGPCAALLAPGAGGQLEIFGEACWLVGGRLGVCAQRGGRQWFVWKNEQVEATPERLAELERFREELVALLAAHA